MNDVSSVGTREHIEDSNWGKKDYKHNATMINNLMIKTIDNMKEKGHFMLRCTRCVCNIKDKFEWIEVW